MSVNREKEILIFCSREVCYQSGSFFANQLGAAFEELGYVVEVCELEDWDDLDGKLTQYIGKRYQLILDFNSILPRLVMEDGRAYPDLLDGPFFDYILDHPLFHYNCLTCAVQNFHVLVLDEAQWDYVEQYYPGVKSVHMLPLGATKALYEGEKKKECRILFPGTYERWEKAQEMIEAAEEPLRSTMKELASRRIEEPSVSMERAFLEYLAEHDRKISGELFARAMNAMYPVDILVRDYFRKAVLDELLKHKFPVTVMGNGWEKYSFSEENSLSREREVPFALSFERIAKEHILLNVSPIFNHGMHDRIPAGMANRAAVLTDENPYLNRQFVDREHLCFYSLSDRRTLTECAGDLLENSGLRERIQETAYQEFKTEHTWRQRAKAILELAEQ